MKSTHRVSVLAAAMLLLGLLTACGSSSVSAPEQALQEFYGHLNEGAYSSALTMYTAEMAEIFADPDSGFEAWARKEARGGTIDRVELISEQESADGAVVDYKVHFSDGQTQSRKVTLVQEDGQWKMGMIG